MPRRSRRARWRRATGHNPAVFVVPAVVVALVLAFVVGALSQVGRGSGPAHRTIDRGFASMASLVAARSRATGLALAQLFTEGPHLDRLAYFSALSSIVSDSSDEARQLDAAVPPAPVGGAGEGCLAAVRERASATAAIAQALEGVLGGRDGSSPLSPEQALATLESAAAAVAQADDDWSGCRRALRHAPGSALLARSAWLSGQTWSTPAALAGFVDGVAASHTLVARHALAVTATSVYPAPLPAQGGPALVAPTRSLTAHVVVTDVGNVDEPVVEVRAALVGGQAAPATLTATVAVQAGASRTVVLGPFSVVPGNVYTLEVQVAPPSGAGTASASKALQVSSEPTTTTTTTSTTTTTTPKHRGIRRSGG